MKNKVLKKLTVIMVLSALIVGAWLVINDKRSEEREKVEDVIELTWYQLGEKQKDTDIVLEKVNDYLAGKIGVKLECIADRSQPDICTLIGVVVSIDRVYDQIHTLGNYQRLEKSPEHSLHTEGNLLIIKGMRCKKLFCILTVFHNRSG